MELMLTVNIERFSIIVFTLLIFILLPFGSAQSASMEEQVKGAHACCALCKTYAEEIGRNGEIFREINIQTLKIAEELGYTEDFSAYVRDVTEMQALLDEMLKKKYGSVSAIYDDWCSRVLSGYIKGLNGN